MDDSHTANPHGCTVYVRNLEESIKIPLLTSSLHEIFSEYGNIIDIIAKKNLRAKGQAFIVFDSPEAAARAKSEVQGFELFGKPMKLEWARTRADAEVKLSEGEEGLEEWKRRRLAEKERKQALMAQEAARLQRTTAVDASAPLGKPAKAQRGAGLKSINANAAAVIPDEYLPPNKILFVQNLPEEYDIDALSGLFGSFDGFKEVRLVPGRQGIAFVEYETEAGAIGAKERTGGMTLGGGQVVKVTYQRQ